MSIIYRERGILRFTILGTSILETSIPVALDMPLPSINANFSSALQNITKQITLLHKFSSIIRGVGRETQDLTDIMDFKIKDKNGYPLEPV